MSPLLILRNVKKIYTEKSYIHKSWNTEILKNVNLTLNHGDFVSILGKSLSGKSTLTGILSGRLPLTEGEMWLKDILVNELSEDEHRNFFGENVGVIFDTLSPYKHFIGSTNELIKQAIIQSQIVEEKEVEIQIQKWLNYVHFTNNPLMPFIQLPFNEKQKAVIAIAFAGNPKLFIADEPTNYLEADFVLSLFEKYNREFNTTIIFLTQIEEEAHRAQKRFVLRDGFIEEG